MVSAMAVSQGPSRTRAYKKEGKGPWGRTRLRQEGDDKSVLRRAVLVEPLASYDDDRGHVWMKMPRADVEES